MSMRTIFLIILAVVVSVFTIVVQWRIKTGKIIPRSTYSYKPFVRTSLIMLCFLIAVVLLVYLRTNSVEAAFTIAIYVSTVIVGGLVFGLLLEYQVKRRGGKKVD